MHYVSILGDDGLIAALLRDGRAYAFDCSLDALVAEGALGSAEPTESDGVPIEALTLLTPVASPGKIVCIGQNYHAHAEEQGKEAPKLPTLFAKFQNALAPPGATVKLPGVEPRRLRGRGRVRGRAAREGCCRGRRARLHRGLHAPERPLGPRLPVQDPQWMPGKVFDGLAPCGPALVTPDEAGPPDAIEFDLRLNGELMQEGTTADLVHSILALVAYLSMLMTLEPGDIVSTGTPAGVGSLRDPRVWLAPGDEVVITSARLGVLETTLA